MKGRNYSAAAERLTGRAAREPERDKWRCGSLPQTGVKIGLEPQPDG